MAPLLCVHASAFWDASLMTLMDIAETYGASAIECRLGADQGHGIEADLSAPACADVRGALSARGLGLALGAGFRLGADPPGTLEALLRVSDRLGARRLRIFIDDRAEGETEEAWRRRIAGANARIRTLTAAWPGMLAVENQGDTGCCATLASLLPPEIGLLWDVGYSLKAGESVEMSLSWAPRITHVHLKDLRREGTRWIPTRLGEGDVGVADIVAGLVARGFPGWVSIETRSDAPQADLAIAARRLGEAAYSDTGSISSMRLPKGSSV